jgi:hypothetical protein
VVHFDLQTWEAAQTIIPKDGYVYQVVSQNYPDYADGLTWTFVPKANSVPMVENVTFPPAGGSFKLEIIWKDKGQADGSQSFGYTFHSSGVLGFLFQKSGIKVQMFMRKTDGSTILFKPLQNTILNDIPIDLTYKEVFTYNADTREYLFEHFEGVDLTTVNASATGFIPIEDGDWGYGPTNEYQLNNSGNQEYLKITVTTPPPGPVPPPFGSSTIDFSSFDQPKLDSIGYGWREIKYLPGDATAWFPGDETWDYTFTEFLFTRGDFSAWLICDKFQAVGEFYNSTPRIIRKSSTSATPYTAIWFNRSIALDPVISLQDSLISQSNGTVMYIENSHTAARSSISPSGMYVFIR